MFCILDDKGTPLVDVINKKIYVILFSDIEGAKRQALSLWTRRTAWWVSGVIGKQGIENLFSFFKGVVEDAILDPGSSQMLLSKEDTIGLYKEG